MISTRHSYDHSRSCSEHPQRVFLPNFFHALEIWFYAQESNYRIFSFCSLWAVKHFINQLCEQSETFLWSLTVLFWALRGFFCPISFHHALEIHFPYIQWLTPQRNCKKYSQKYALWAIKHLVSNLILPYERSKTFLWSFPVLFWVLTEGLFVQFLASHPGNLFSPYHWWFLCSRKTIIGYLNFFPMSAHKMWPLTTYNLDMFIPTSWGNIVLVCNGEALLLQTRKWWGKSYMRQWETPLSQMRKWWGKAIWDDEKHYYRKRESDKGKVTWDDEKVRLWEMLEYKSFIFWVLKCVPMSACKGTNIGPECKVILSLWLTHLTNNEAE